MKKQKCPPMEWWDVPANDPERKKICESLFYAANKSARRGEDYVDMWRNRGSSSRYSPRLENLIKLIRKNLSRAYVRRAAAVELNYDCTQPALDKRLVNLQHALKQLEEEASAAPAVAAVRED